ncbi:YceI family protein [Salinimicrobium catena]|nr:YceI family protein [Salinimicrobium catena]
MKKTIMNLFLFTGIAASTIACKNEAKNKVEPGEAKEAATPTEEAATYEIDTTASTIEWRGTKPTGEHKGTINIESGNIMATQEAITGGKVTIDMNSIKVTDEGMDEKDRTSLENHLKGTVEGKETDFFNVKKYPTATFEITGITEKDGQKMLEGNLTLKDETKNIQFPIDSDIDEEELSLESETFTIDRTNWKVNYGSKSVFDNLGDNFISDDMELTIKVKAKRS